jgi:hypothetical protein
MPYQPNLFVNPNQRGFELPAGCKNLKDVLARVGQRPFAPHAGVQAGGLGSIRDYLSDLYEAKSPWLVLVVMHSERGAVLILSYAAGGFGLTLLLHRGSTFLEEAILELFGEKALTVGGDTAEFREVNVQLPDFLDDAAQRVIDLLIRGYGVSDHARLLFHYQETEERG